MKVLFDTSVLVAGILQNHAFHFCSFPWLQAVQAGRIEMVVATHCLAEVYSTLSGTFQKPILPTPVARQLIENEILALASVVSLDVTDYHSCITRMALAGHRGGLIYDGLLIEAALKANVDCVLTRNFNHFLKLWPKNPSQVLDPLTSQAP